MALVVEDGTGIAGANSYVSAADCADYAATHGLTFTANAAGDAALVRGTDWLDATYISRWPGTRAHGRNQGLQWPRAGATDIEGYAIASTEVPMEVIDACCEAACREFKAAGSLAPDVTPNAIIQSASVEGAVSVTYATGKGVAGAGTVSLTIDGILAPLIGIRPSASVFSASARA